MVNLDNKRPQSLYRGRFAPSPSGLLHFGSLVTALASYLDAKHNNGTWLVRIEDIDPPRELAGASSEILKTLESYGLHWDESVLYQSQQTQIYHQTLNQLAKNQLIYYCQCTRAQIKKFGGIYPSICKTLNLPSLNNATRLINNAGVYEFNDTIQGLITGDKKVAAEDFTLVRKDGLFAYQLAVVVDDIFQNITHVVRGCDLLEPTLRQLSFFEILNTQAPIYSHIPLAVTKEGYKLSKQNKAPAINNQKPQPALISALHYLGQNPPEELRFESVENIISWAISHWSMSKITQKQEIVIQ
ncbi:tRNA glutamyl-Q(34) synthetase GluQRS [Colwellia sp. RE-S-Sl-9]